MKCYQGRPASEDAFLSIFWGMSEHPQMRPGSMGLLRMTFAKLSVLGTKYDSVL